MLSEPTNGAAADALIVAASGLERDGDRGGVEALPGDLEALTEALRATSNALATSGTRVVPAAQPLDQGLCSRYQRAAAMWPTDPPPSHERLAAALTHLHGAAGATRLAARRCDEAPRTVEGLLRTSQGSRSS
jgi:hypothetical protein